MGLYRRYEDWEDNWIGGVTWSKCFGNATQIKAMEWSSELLIVVEEKWWFFDSLAYLLLARGNAIFFGRLQAEEVASTRISKVCAERQEVVEIVRASLISSELMSLQVVGRKVT
jgi:hypothetical protein